MEQRLTATGQQTGTSVPKIFTILWGLFLDAGLGLLAYFGLRLAGFAPYYALLAGAVVTGLRLLYGLLRARRLEGFAAFMCLGFLISMALAFVTGSERFLLLKDSFSTAVFALVMFGSCVFGKPFMYHASKRFRAAGGMEEDEWERKWREAPGFRKLFRFITVIWGIVFLLEALIRVPIVYGLPIDLAATTSGVLMPVMIVGLLVWTLRYARGRERSLRQASLADGS